MNFARMKGVFLNLLMFALWGHALKIISLSRLPRLLNNQNIFHFSNLVCECLIQVNINGDRSGVKLPLGLRGDFGFPSNAINPIFFSQWDA